jgi:hypothetical protein
MNNFRVLKSVRAATAVCIATVALGGVSAASAQTPDLTGNTWSGWTVVGDNSQLGIYAKGSHPASTVPEGYTIYTAVFESTGPESIPGNLFNKPANDFAVGNRILAIGMERTSGNWTYPFMKLDFDNNSYTASTTPPVSSSTTGDGQTSGGGYATIGDATVQFQVATGQPAQISIYTENGLLNGGTGSAAFQSHPCGSYGCANGLPSIRGFLNEDEGYYFKMYFDLTTLPTAYPNNVTGGTQAIGVIQNDLTISIAAISPGNTTAESTIKVSTQAASLAPALTCQGFEAPLNTAVAVRKNARRILPFRMNLLDSVDMPVQFLLAAPILKVTYSGNYSYNQGFLEELSSVGQGDDGNSFTWNGEYWAFNLLTRGLASGTYNVSVLSGDDEEYTVDTTCQGLFQIE